MAKQSLVIVESPAKAKTIGKYLGKDYEVKACMGHLRDLQKSKLSVDVDNDFEPVYKPIKGKEAIISDLKKSAKAADTVYLATDPDREGEAISWHLKSLLDLPDKKTKRVTFNEITKNVVRQSIENPRDIDQNLVDASRPGVFWTDWWAISSVPCCGRRSSGACPQDGSSLLPPEWWMTGSGRSRISSRRNTGRWTPTSPAMT